MGMAIEKVLARVTKGPRETAMSEQLSMIPADEHNQSLVANVRPPGWVNPTPRGRYNMVVIGAGSAGLVTAAGAAALGASVALVESHLLGGDCLNYGCVPSKALIHCARQVKIARDAAACGAAGGGAVEVDFRAVMQRMREIRSEISTHDSAKRFRNMGVDVFFGQARFVGPDCVDVAGRLLPFARACIATGAKPRAPDIDGLAEAGFLTNETVFSLTERPKRLAVLGAGPLGCELAQAMARLGCRVTIIARHEEILPREDAMAAALVAEALAKDGVDIRRQAALTRAAVVGGGKELTFDDETTVEVDEILVAVGRAPVVDGLDLDAADVAHDVHRGVVVDDRLRTTNRRIYAAGDVCLQEKFTHAADAAARIVLANALFFGHRSFRSLTIPHCTYTDPEIASVGLTERAAQQQGIPIRTFTQSLSQVDRAITDGRTDGVVCIHTRRRGDRIVGATIVGDRAGEMIGEITLAMRTGAGLKDLAEVIHPYPTISQAIQQAADQYNRARLTPRVRKFFETLLRWRRGR